MVNKWDIRSFGDCAELIRDGVSPGDAGGANYIGLEHIGQGTLSLMSYGKSEDVSSVKSKFQRGDILYGKLRPYFRKVIKAPFDGVCSTDIWVVRPKKDIDTNYLFYWMASNKFINASMRGSEGTKMPRAQWEFVSRIENPIPPYPEQQKIGKTLRFLDEKIELNQKMNQTLGAMVQAIFKSWFVDFDPVRAKAKGRDPGLPKHIADLFPSSFEDSELGDIPKGWEMRSVYDCAYFINGLAYRNDDFSDDPSSLPIIKIAELKYGITGQTKFTLSEAEDKYRITSGDLLFSWSGSPDTSIDTFVWTGRSGWLNQHIFKIQFKNPREKYFVHYLLRYLKQTFIEIARNKQTTGLGHVTAQDLKRLKTTFPSDDMLNAFNRISEPIYEKIYNNTCESNTLSAIRDSLLPKLISGDIKVSGAAN